MITDRKERTEQTLRILYDHQAFSLQDGGGISRYYCQLLRQLSHSGSCLVEVVLGFHQNLYPLCSTRKIRSWECRNSFVKAGKVRYVVNETLSNIVLSLHDCFDVYHPTLYRHVAMARWKKMVITHHDCAYERYPALFKNVSAIRKMRIRQFEMADAIICPSESTRRDLHEFYSVPESKTFVIYHGVNELQPDTDRDGFGVGRPYLLYVGSRAKYKNFLGLVEAFSLAGLRSEFDLVAIGGGEPSYSEMTLLAERDLDQCVHFVPRVPDSLLAHAYQRAHLLIYPSLYEGFGFPPVEAMSLGCPVLVARASCLPEICKDAAFYFSPEDIGDFAAMLKNACFDESGRSMKIQCGRLMASTYTWESCAAKTVEVYKQ